MKSNKRNRIFSILISLAVMISCLLALFQVRGEISGIYDRLLGKNITISTVQLDVNRAVASDPVGSDQAEQDREESEEEEIFNLLFLLSCMAVMGGSFTAGVFLKSFLCGNYDLIKDKGLLGCRFMSRLRYYRKWSIKFLSPIQKILSSCSDLYDINPIGKRGLFSFAAGTAERAVQVESRPAFVASLQNAGFLYVARSETETEGGEFYGMKTRRVRKGIIRGGILR